MKVRKLAVALALAGGLGSGVAQALGLGEIELQSYLNEPLDAEIILPQSQGVSPDDVIVELAPDSAYQRVGLARSAFLGKLRFKVVTGGDGNLRVDVTSREPLREPYLNFLLELSWPQGRLMREYAVLVDPPVYAEQSGEREAVSAPSASPAPASQTRQQESARRQAQTVNAYRDTGTSANRAPTTLGPTTSSDTLWSLASRVRPDDSVTVQQAMLALQDQNPDAFMGGNINRLKRGEILRVPTRDQMQRRTASEAAQQVREQNQAFKAGKRTVDATANTAKASGQGAPARSGDELKLLVADNKDAQSAEKGGSAGGDGKLPGGVDAGTAVAMEQLESVKRENADLNSRVNDLQDQVETLQRLLELKNSQLADLQKSAGQTANADVQPGTAAEPAAAAGDGAQPEMAGDTTTPMTAEAGKPEQAPAGDEAATPAPDQAGTNQSASDQAMTEPASDDATAVSSTEATDAQGDSAAESAAEPAPAAQPAAKAEPAKPKAEPEPAKGFAGNVIDQIINNPLYQIALGGGLVLLLLLLLLVARRNANREKAFYDQLNSETGDEGDGGFDLSLDDEPDADDTEQGEGDVIAEANSYIAYGRHAQAAQVLETAISREPSRSDLRLKLLSVYADLQDRDAFEKQFGELSAMGDDDALAEAESLKTRLEEAEAMPSIDDLESQLRSDSFAAEPAGEPEDRDDEVTSDELLADQYDASRQDDLENEFRDFDLDFNSPAGEVAAAEAEANDESEAPAPVSGDARDDAIEFDLSGLEDRTTGDLETVDEGDLESDSEATDYSSLEIDLEDETASADGESEAADDELPSLDENDTTAAAGDVELDGLDESFLDELDAELDKVAGEDDELAGDDLEAASLDDLELDVSDEDLALMEEFSDSADSANHAAQTGDEAEEAASEIDEELSLEDTLGEGDLVGEERADTPEDEVAGVETLEELDELDDVTLDDLASLEDAGDAEEDVPLASESIDEAPTSKPSSADVLDLDENDLGDDDDFDFLAGTDEAATKLDLARAYLEMGDSDGARDILEEVALEGNEEQQAEARDLLKNLS
ncbi:FimV/HubP family polar landmark protein [Marinobacter sp. C2H3]|uniref:FimV/HubP family polar landmark protein n=1 Tax=Marinobacter sp. C2H3 TaxID=3119003 RepID=UPI00300F142C